MITDGTVRGAVSSFSSLGSAQCGVWGLVRLHPAVSRTPGPDCPLLSGGRGHPLDIMAND